MPVRTIRDDITNVSADIIVNTANPMPVYTTGIDKAIYEAAGAEKLLAERKKIGEIARGDIAVTPALALSAKYIIHAVGPRWDDGKSGEYDILRSCYRKSLEKAVELHCKSIAIPLISSGGNKVPKADAMQIALEVINRFLLQHDLDVTLVVFDSKSFELSERLFQEVRAYIDQHYVDERQKEEYPHKDAAAISSMNTGVSSKAVLSQQEIIGSIKKLTTDTLKGLKEESFQEYLIHLMQEKNLDSPDVYNAALLDRRMFSRMLNDKKGKPKKPTVAAIALALKLDINQAERLYAKAGYALTMNSELDLVIRWCMENHMYNVEEVNYILDDLNLPILGSIVRE